MAALIKVIHILDRFNPFVRWLHMAGMGICFLWACFIFTDVILRYVFNRPFAASTTVCELTLLVVVFFGVAYTQLEKGHIAVDAITSRLPPRAAIVLDTTVSLISLVLVGVLIWQGVENTLAFTRTGITGGGMYEIPLSPFAALIPFGCTLLLVMLLRDLLTKMVEAMRLRLGVHIWSLMLGVPVLIMVLLLLWMQPVLPAISPPIVGLIALAALVILVFSGMPIAFVLIILGVVSLGHLTNPVSGFSSVGTGLYWHVADYGWSVIALFILMGFFVIAADIGKDAYDTAYKWVGHIRGGLAATTIGGSTGFAAVCGDDFAAIATMSTIALPEMKRYRYADSLATGAVAAGATLGPMIPPSIGFIVYGILSYQSIGKLFIAGIIPGLLLALSFVAVIYIMCRRNPKLGPPGERSSWGPRLRSLKGSGPILLLFLVVIGGIYAGIFTAMEGGAIGAFMAFFIALVTGRLTRQKFKLALVDGGKFIVSLLFMIVGSMIFSHALAGSNLTRMLAEFIGGLTVHPLVIMGCIMLMYLILGCITSAPIVLILTVPILAPILSGLGFDLIWVGVLLVLLTNLGVITPPYGMGVFLLKGVAKDVDLFTIYRGVIPFVVSSIVVAVLILFFPSLATWLPNQMMK